jgi:hypothetical protein
MAPLLQNGMHRLFWIVFLIFGASGTAFARDQRAPIRRPAGLVQARAARRAVPPLLVRKSTSGRMAGFFTDALQAVAKDSVVRTLGGSEMANARLREKVVTHFGGERLGRVQEVVETVAGGLRGLAGAELGRRGW